MEGETKDVSVGEYFSKTIKMSHPIRNRLQPEQYLFSGLYRAHGMTPSACTENKERAKGWQFLWVIRHKFYNFKDCEKVVKGMNKKKKRP